MFKARRTYWLAQIGGWALLSLLIFSASTFSNQKIELKMIVISTACFFVFGILLTHLMRFFFIRMGWLNMRLTNLIPRIIITSIVVAAIMSLLNILVSHLISKTPLKFSVVEFSLDVSATLIFFVLWNGVYFTFHFFQRSREQEVNNLQLTASHNEIELKNLRSQLNPHFLFNSLNSIRALIDIEPHRAQENITKLSNLLRKSLIIGSEQLVPLDEELSIVQDYLDLEKVRFEERLEIQQEFDASVMNFLIPPFMLQTLVENALKHGVAQLIEGGTVWIRAKKIEDSVVLEVENTGNLRSNKKDSIGIGISNTLRRLELQYRGKATFNLKQNTPNTVIAIIEIKDL
ncbi:histidine kinase [Fluviicola sp.]|uniref:sensor histidine kinase n=1 Tax=Fluviicola sp. TaxID=1917219 RepID=UPI00261EF2F4|nr:histidine kinase [Fluviicola sp.]